MKKLILCAAALMLTALSVLGQGVKIQAFTTNSGPVVSNIVVALSSNLMPNRLAATNTIPGLIRVYAATNGSSSGFWLDPTAITPGAATNVIDIAAGTGIVIVTNSATLRTISTPALTVSNFIANLNGLGTNTTLAIARTNRHGGTYFVGFGQPADTMTAASGGAGNISNDDLNYRVTFYGPSGESIASKRTTPIALDGERATVSNIPISTDPYIIGRKVYRESTNLQASIYFLVTNIANNTTTTISDNMTEPQLQTNSVMLDYATDGPYLFDGTNNWYNWKRHHVLAFDDSETQGTRDQISTPSGKSFMEVRGESYSNANYIQLYLANVHQADAATIQVISESEHSDAITDQGSRITFHWGTNTGSALRWKEKFHTFGTGDQMLIHSTSNGIMSFGGTNGTRLMGSNVLIPTKGFTTAQEGDTVYIGNSTNYVKIHTNRVTISSPLNILNSMTVDEDATIKGTEYFFNTSAWIANDDDGSTLYRKLRFGAGNTNVFEVGNYSIEEIATNVGIQLLVGSYKGDGSGLTNLGPSAIKANNSPSAGYVATYVDANTWAWASNAGGSGGGIATNNGTGVDNIFTNGTIRAPQYVDMAAGGNEIVWKIAPPSAPVTLGSVSHNKWTFNTNVQFNVAPVGDGSSMTNLIPSGFAATNSGSANQVFKRISNTQGYWGDDNSGGGGTGIATNGGTGINNVFTNAQMYGTTFFQGDSNPVFVMRITPGSITKFLYATNTTGETRFWIDQNGDFGGSAGGFTNLNASSLASGTVAAGRLVGTAGTNWSYLSLTNLVIQGTGPGSIQLQDSAGGETVTISAPTTLVSNYSLILPTTNGANDYTLKLGDSGQLYWGASGNGSQTPWASAIDGAGYALNNAGNITSSGQVYGDVISTNSHSRFYRLYEEYDSGTSAASKLQGTFGGSVFYNVATSDGQHLGQAVINSASSTTNGFGTSVFTSHMLGGGPTMYETVIKIGTLGTGGTLYSLDIGAGSASGTADFASGVWFRYASDLNSGNWICMSANGGSVTTSNTTTAASTSWVRLGWSTPASGSPITYYINGTPVITNTSPNVPTNNTFGLIYRCTERSGSGTTRQTFVDYTDYTVYYTTPR